MAPQNKVDIAGRLSPMGMYCTQQRVFVYGFNTLNIHMYIYIQ